MPVINTPEDLLRLLDENAEFREAVRRYILTDELLRLPERFAQFVDRVDAFIEEQTGVNQRMDAFIEEQKGFNEGQRASNEEQIGVNQRVDAFIEEQKAFNEQQIGVNQRVDAFIEEQKAFNEQQVGVNQRVDAFIEEQKGFNEGQRAFDQRMETAVGELRGNVARQIVGMYRREIAAGLELVYQRSLDRHELFAMLPPITTSGIARGDWHSFYRADLVLEATDREGHVHYVAVEASYTADRRDTDRASRNAALLEQLNGQPSHAVIASVRNDHETQALVDDLGAHWYALDPTDFTPD